MGTPGVAWDVPKASIVEALKRNKGRLIATAKDLDCSFPTIDKYIKQDPELVELLGSLRRGQGHWRVSLAEDKIVEGLQHPDIKVALQSAFFTLNTDDMAKECGWGNDKKEENVVQQQIAQFKLSLAEQQELAELRSLRRASQNGLPASVEQPLANSDTPQLDNPTQT